MGEVYEAYDMEVQGIGRGRGAIILMTDKGIRQVAALNGTDERLLQEKQFKDSIYEKGFCYIDRVVPNSDEELVTCDRYGKIGISNFLFIDFRLKTIEIHINIRRHNDIISGFRGMNSPFFSPP